ncbi:hypothetical protein BGI51_21080 [Pseudomonas oryzihabitans]|nr:hypothetical protein BGI51_21080 [Pseudomonas psychrotolerans]
MKVPLPASWEARTRSARPMMETSAVALSSTCQLLPMPGSANLIICGKVIRVKVCQRLSP